MDSLSILCVGITALRQVTDATMVKSFGLCHNFQTHGTMRTPVQEFRRVVCTPVEILALSYHVLHSPYTGV